MAPKTVPNYLDGLDFAKLIKKHGSERAAAKALGVPRSTFKDAQARAKEGTMTPVLARDHKIKGTLKFIFTCAVQGARVHQDFYKNLQAYADFIGAELVVGAITNLSDEEFSIETTQEPFSIGSKIRWCPELNILPSIINPLGGLQTYSKGMWAIFPHTKVALDSVPTHRYKPAKQIMTTGAVTLPAYSATKAGHRAKFDHVCAALVVEVNSEGVWPRHVHATNQKDGSFYDLQYFISDGAVMKHDGVSGIVYGDIHVEHLDEAVENATWGSDDSLAALLNPKRQVVHDLLDFESLNYHELGDVFARYKRMKEGRDNIEAAVRQAFEFLDHISAYSDEVYVVESNHDHFVKKWLNLSKPATRDLSQLVIWHRLSLAFLENSIREDSYSPLECVFRAVLNGTPGHFNFLKEDEELKICGVSCDYHGHRGANGSRGSKNSFTFVTEKTMIGHLHSPSIYSGTYTVGTSGSLTPGFTSGPSSWAHTHGVIYPNGQRALLTLSAGKFWADQEI